MAENQGGPGPRHGAIRLSALVMSEHDPAVALWPAAGYAHDARVGRFVRSLR
jgi:hypothetical protein